jgi:hypothetical protein
MGWQHARCVTEGAASSAPDDACLGPRSLTPNP